MECDAVAGGAVVKGTDCALVAVYGAVVVAATDDGTPGLEASKVAALVGLAVVAGSVLTDGGTGCAAVCGALIVDVD